MRRNIFILLIHAIMVLIVSSCGGKEGKEATIGKPCEISGAGTTFPVPFYLMTFDAYETIYGNTIRYDECGTGSGIRLLQEKKVDFAACDKFLTDEQMSKMQPVVHIPTCIIATALTYNLPGIGKLKLSGEVVAGIYSGNITVWNDKRIRALNPGVALPAENIIPIYRVGNRSITFLLTSYLSVTSEEWKKEHGGATMSITVPRGLPASDNADVVVKLKETPYSIGYMGYEYAQVMKMPMVALENANGEFITPSAASISAATATSTIPSDARILLINSPAKGAYPITSFSWILIYQEQNYNNRTEEQAYATVNLLKYMLRNDIQQSAKDLGFSPFPKFMAQKSIRILRTVTYNGKLILR